ncbi:MAG: outer membrane beta-barrel protein [Bacteroidetes bacterium]|nr:outer membrane beta-barrel protein [Bacteroidota bacterium]
MTLKRIFLLVVTLLSSMASFAQFAFNPQIGLSVAKLRNLESEESTKARVGWHAGADFRIGRRFYVQPGIYYWQTSTAFINDSLRIQTDLQRSDIKLNARLGLNLLDDENAKIRFNVGPSYNVLVSKSAKSDDLDKVTLGELEDNFNNGVFNFDAGLGIDFWKISFDLGYSIGLSDALDNTAYYKSEARYGTFYFNVGLVIGNATSSK